MEPLELLTKAEVDLLKLVLEGLNTKQIARVFGCSVQTVEHSRRQIFQKLGIKPGRECVTPKEAMLTKAEIECREKT